MLRLAARAGFELWPDAFPLEQAGCMLSRPLHEAPFNGAPPGHFVTHWPRRLVRKTLIGNGDATFVFHPNGQSGRVTPSLLIRQEIASSMLSRSCSKCRIVRVIPLSNSVKERKEGSDAMAR